MLQYFVRHNFVARWQDKQFQNCLKTFPSDTIVSIIHFVENYSFGIQNEVQSMHCHNYQMTILVHISWIMNPNPNLDDENLNTTMRYHLYISNEKTHDKYFVQHCLLLHWEDLVKGGFGPNQHWIWFDSCDFQFKNKVLLYFVSRYPHLVGGYICMWNFFGFGHGKGLHDGTRVVLKWFIIKCQLDVIGHEL